MINILKKGYKTQLFYQTTCCHCHCEFECEKSDFNNIYCDDQRDGIQGEINCPCCEKVITVGLDYCKTREVKEEF